MKTLVLVLILATLTVTGHAQGYFLGIKHGISWTNVSNEDGPFLPSGKVGFNSGLSLEYRTPYKRVFGLNLLYSQRGFTTEIHFTDDLGKPTGESQKVIFCYDYLSLPVKWGFSLGDEITAGINLGLVPAFLVRAITTEGEIPGLTEKTTYNVRERVRKFDLSGLAEIKIAHRYKDQFSLYTIFAYQHSLNSITTDEYFPNWKLNHKGLTFSIGIDILGNF